MTLTRLQLLTGVRTTRSGVNPATPDDRELIKLLIDLEELQIAVYRHAATIPVSAPVRRFAAQALQRERLHRAILARLERTRDITPNRTNRYQFNATDDQTFLSLARRVEDAAQGGYNGAIVRLEQPGGLANVLAPIAADEAAHAGAVYTLSGLDAVVRSFDGPVKPADTQRILSAPEG